MVNPVGTLSAETVCPGIEGTSLSFKKTIKQTVVKHSFYSLAVRKILKGGIAIKSGIRKIPHIVKAIPFLGVFALPLAAQNVHKVSLKILKTKEVKSFQEKVEHLVDVVSDIGMIALLTSVAVISIEKLLFLFDKTTKVTPFLVSALPWTFAFANLKLSIHLKDGYDLFSLRKAIKKGKNITGKERIFKKIDLKAAKVYSVECIINDKAFLKKLIHFETIKKVMKIADNIFNILAFSLFVVNPYVGGAFLLLSGVLALSYFTYIKVNQPQYTLLQNQG